MSAGTFRSICITLWMATALTFGSAASAAACRLALLLAIDVSASVDREEFALQRDGLAAALVAPEVVEAFLSAPEPVAIAAFEWSGQWNQRLVIDWRLIESQADLQQAAADLTEAQRGASGFPTSIGYALGYASGLMQKAPNCTRQTIDLSGDGKNNNGYSPTLAYNHFPLGHVTVNALAIGGAMKLRDLTQYFQREVIQGPNAFVEVARDHRDFERAMRRKLEREVSSRSIVQLAE